VGAGAGATEPLQLAVRSVIERAAVEMVANLYGMPGPEACMRFDPLGETVTTGVTGAYIPAYDNLKSNNANTRADAYRWDSRNDPPPAASQSDDRGRGYGDDRDRY
jgi:curli production assembly/transport component CsgG/holdfast attachment protein HfaB